VKRVPHTLITALPVIKAVIIYLTAALVQLATFLQLQVLARSVRKLRQRVQLAVLMAAGHSLVPSASKTAPIQTVKEYVSPVLQ
jgi:hypothetical protein